MTMIANKLTPFYPIHPGEILKDEIEYRHTAGFYESTRHPGAEPLSTFPEDAQFPY